MKLLKNSWRPSNNFLKKGFSYYLDENLKKEKIEWSFKILKDFRSPVHLIKCEIRGFGLVAEGYGDDLFITKAFKKSFAESWERLWMFKYDLNSDISIENSNGFAAGRTIEESILNSRMELIERKIFIDNWCRFNSWIPYSLKNNRNKILKYILESNQFKIHLFEIKINKGIFLIGCSQNRGLYFDSIYSENKSEKNTENKLLSSLFRSMWKDALYKNTDAVSLDELSLSSQIENHLLFYLDKKNHRVIDEIYETDKTNEIFYLEDINYIKSEILTKANLFPAVCISRNTKWRNINWGKDSFVNKDDKWPHPLD